MLTNSVLVVYRLNLSILTEILWEEKSGAGIPNHGFFSFVSIARKPR